MNYLQTVLLSVVLASGIIVAMDTDSFANEEVKTKKEVVKEVVQYNTDRETFLYNKVEKTVDLPGFGDYQDLLASYAYNTCNKVIKSDGKYSCENLVQTWNAENGGWKRNATNTANKNGTHDGGLCQLNSAYHAKFIKSERFNNPLAQLDYCLQVRVDAERKGVMPRYAYNVRHKRDRGIVFTKSDGGIVNVTVKPTENLRQKAKDQEVRTQKLKDQYLKEEAKTIEFWGTYINSKSDNK